MGRDDEPAEPESLLLESRLVTVAGVAGVGKTRLVSRAAALAEKRYCDGVWIAELSAVHDPALVEYALAEALGLTDHTSRPPRTALLDHCAARRLLLVLDGFEHLTDVCAGLVRELLRRAPGLQVLAAGRRPLRVDGELTFSLLPMSDADALELFTRRAAAVRPGFRLADRDRETVRELCRRLDGIPLALELAAGRLRALTAVQVLHRLDDRFRLLTGGSPSALPRHRTLRTAIGWSHELCAPEQRLLWARLSVFAGPFDLEAVEYICSGPCLPADSVLDVLPLPAAGHRTGARRRVAAGDRGRRAAAPQAPGLAPGARDMVRAGLVQPPAGGGRGPDRQRAVQSPARDGVLDGAPGGGPSRAVPRRHALVLLGGLRSSRRGAPLAGPRTGGGVPLRLRATEQGAADRIWPSVGLSLFGSAHYGWPRAECEERARAQLGDARYDAERRSGRRLEAEAAVARALGAGTDDGTAPEGTRVEGTPEETPRPAASRTTRRGGPELD